MQKKRYIIIFFFSLICFLIGASDEDYLKIDAKVNPKNIKKGEEGILKIKITPKSPIKISSHPEFLIKLDNNLDLSFPKIFFTASELDFQTMQDTGTVILDLEKEIEIPFKVNKDVSQSKHIINGEVVFTAVFKDNWSVKTYQKFNTQFSSSKEDKTKKK